MKQDNDAPKPQEPQQQQHQQVQQLQKRKIGEGAGQAAFRQGFKELAGALRALQDSLPLVEEVGQMNSVPTHGIAQQAGYALPVTNLHPQQGKTVANFAPAKAGPTVTSHGPAEQQDQPEFQSSLGKLVAKLRHGAPSMQPEREIGR